MSITRIDESIGVSFGKGDIAIKAAPVTHLQTQDQTVRALIFKAVPPLITFQAVEGRVMDIKEVFDGPTKTPEVVILFDRHETVDIVLEELYKIKDALKAKGR